MSSIDTRQKLIYGDGALQKASLTYKNAQTGPGSDTSSAV